MCERKRQFLNTLDVTNKKKMPLYGYEYTCITVRMGRIRCTLAKLGRTNFSAGYKITFPQVTMSQRNLPLYTFLSITTGGSYTVYVLHEEHWLLEKRQFPDHNNYKQYTEFDGYFNYTLYIYMETVITIELATSQDKMNTFLKKKKVYIQKQARQK